MSVVDSIIRVDAVLAIFTAHLHCFQISMQTAVMERAVVSLRPSVCLSITFWCFVQTSEDTILRSSASGRTIILVSEEVKFIWIFAGGHPQRGR